MKKINIILVFVAFLTLPYICMAQSKKKADKETAEWRYEIEAVGTGTQGTYQIKAWSYSKNPETAIEQAKKNAVHGIIFKGFPDKDRVKGQKALAQSPNLEQEKEAFFMDFFKTGGKYQKFVALTNNGAIAAGDRIKISKKEYKIGVVVSINVAALRKDLEDAGIIKGLGSGF
jgi:hypothetical protein